MSESTRIPNTKYQVPPHGTLQVWSHGADDAPLLVALHGFTLTGESFGRFASVAGLRVLAPDLPGHGGTEVRPVDMATTAAALAAWMGAGPGPSPVLGYSMGGRVALHLAAARPDLVTSLILVSATPGLNDPARAERRQEDLALAEHIVSVGLDAFLDEWAEHPLVGTGHLCPEERARDRAVRSANTAGGLAAAVRGLGQGTPERIDPAALAMPVLWVAGTRDARYAAIAREAGGDAAAIVPGAGHNIVADAPTGLAGIVRAWLAGP